MAHVRQSQPHFGRGFYAMVRKTFQVVPPSRDNKIRERRRGVHRGVLSLLPVSAYTAASLALSRSLSDADGI
jgi:hypothetical protein